ncbi:MAG: hypothetical protein JWO15_2642 [Sphingomonadales bacterium]|nr:hypothetical protein [Sphingomonadales bacterium]
MLSFKSRFLAIAVASMFMQGTAMATTATATATVVTIRPMTLVKTSDLDFGSLIPSASAGTVVIDPTNNARTTTTGGVSAAGGAPSAARFTGTGILNLAAFITLPTSITLTNGTANTMTVSNITTNGGTTRLFIGAAIDVRVGGTLGVAANQAVGNYVGQFNVTVVYL